MSALDRWVVQTAAFHVELLLLTTEAGNQRAREVLDRLVAALDAGGAQPEAVTLARRIIARANVV